jgi:hypothetical protein
MVIAEIKEISLQLYPECTKYPVYYRNSDPFSIPQEI